MKVIVEAAGSTEEKGCKRKAVRERLGREPAVGEAKQDAGQGRKGRPEESKGTGRQGILCGQEVRKE